MKTEQKGVATAVIAVIVIVVVAAAAAGSYFVLSGGGAGEDGASGGENGGAGEGGEEGGESGQEDLFAGTWRGSLSGEATGGLLAPWRTGFEMDIVNLKVGERQKVPGHAIFTRAVSGYATVHYSNPVWMGTDPCPSEAELESASLSGPIAGEILTLEWGISSGETAWCLELSYDEVAPVYMVTYYYWNGKSCEILYTEQYHPNDLLGVEYSLNTGHSLDMTINNNDSLALHEENPILPGIEWAGAEYEIDGVLYGVIREEDTLGDTIGFNERITTDEHTRKKIEIPGVGEVIVNTNSEVEFETNKSLEQFRGETFSKIEGLEPPEFEIRTPVSVAGVRGTQFVTNVENDGTTTLTVLEGSVEFSDLGGGKTVVVGVNQTSVVELGGLPSDPVSIDYEIPRWWE